MMEKFTIMFTSTFLCPQNYLVVLVEHNTLHISCVLEGNYEALLSILTNMPICASKSLATRANIVLYTNLYRFSIGIKKHITILYDDV